MKTGRRRKLSYETRLTLMSLAAGFPAVLIALIILWAGDYTTKVQWTLTVVIVAFWLGFAFAARERVVRPLQTISNLLAAVREEDFSIRARAGKQNDALGEVFLEVNALSQMLKDQRLGALEATALLRTVMAEIDVAVFTFDDQRRLRLVNRAGERLLAQPAERLLGQTAVELGLGACLEAEVWRPLPMTFPGGSGRWGVRVSTFRADSPINFWFSRT
jgi:two-component system nitrogen regulation sensor histidine kinase NtrY